MCILQLAASSTKTPGFVARTAEEQCFDRAIEAGELAGVVPAVGKLSLFTGYSSAEHFLPSATAGDETGPGSCMHLRLDLQD